MLFTVKRDNWYSNNVADSPILESYTNLTVIRKYHVQLQRSRPRIFPFSVMLSRLCIVFKTHKASRKSNAIKPIEDLFLAHFRNSNFHSILHTVTKWPIMVEPVVKRQTMSIVRQCDVDVTAIFYAVFEKLYVLQTYTSYFMTSSRHRLKCTLVLVNKFLLSVYQNFRVNSNLFVHG